MTNMLVGFSVSNYKSFKNEQNFSMVASKIASCLIRSGLFVVKTKMQSLRR